MLADFDLNDIGHRIINGTQTPGLFPYQLQLKYETNHYCGAVLISPRFALSAHHCLTKPIKQFQMVAGTYFWYGSEKTQQMRNLKTVTQLNNKSGEPKKYASPDIVIIEFDR